MRVSMIVLVFFRVRTRLRRISPPFPTRFLPRQYIRRLSGRRRSHRSESMLLLLATHVDLELSFGSSSNQPLSYCSEKRSLHLQLEKRTLLFSLDRSASCDCWRSQGSTGAQPQRPASARGRRRGFLSDRKYRYHPRTQADVADCWPSSPPPPPPPPPDPLLTSRAAICHAHARYLCVSKEKRWHACTQQFKLVMFICMQDQQSTRRQHFVEEQEAAPTTFFFSSFFWSLEV